MRKTPVIFLQVRQFSIISNRFYLDSCSHIVFKLHQVKEPDYKIVSDDI